MQRCCRTVAALFSLMAVLFSCFLLPAYAETEPIPSTSEAKAVWFSHLESGREMVTQNADEVLPAGSTVKILSGLLACERLGGQLTQSITVTKEMLEGASQYQYGRLQPGTQVTVQDLLYLAVCGSYNNAYYALAYLTGGGDMQAFVALMNQRAKELGAEQTTLGDDPTGLKDNSTTTARDLFHIAYAATQNSLYMQISSSGFYDLSSGHRISNRNALISKAERTDYYNPLCKGLSAGMTRLGGASLVTLAQKGEDRYLCVVLGADEIEIEGQASQIYSYIIANRLIKWGYENYSYVELLGTETEICTIPVKVSDLTDTVSVVPKESFSYYLPLGSEEEISFSVRLAYKELEAPITEGTHVGYVALVYRGEILGTVPIVTAGGAERSGFVSRLMRIRTLTEDRAAMAGLIFFLVAVTAWILTEILIRRHRRHKWDKYFSEKIDLHETILNRTRKR